MNILKKLGIVIMGALLGESHGAAKNFSYVDMNEVVNNIKVILWQDVNSSKVLDQAKKWKKSIRGNGSWIDLDYQDKSRTPWSPQQHLNRILEMSFAYTSERMDTFKDIGLGSAIISALNYWISVSPICTNWWFNDISVPQTIGKILILLDETECLNMELRDQLILCMKKGNLKKHEGANKMDIALHYLFRAALTGDDKLMKETVKEAFGVLSKGKREGIQIDDSYHQHGDQLYISGYGDVLIDGVLSIACYLKGTDYGLSEEQLNVLSDFVLNGYGSIFRSVYKDYNAGGRLLSRKNALRKSDIVKKLELLSELDVQNELNYQELAREIESVSNVKDEYNRLFWRSDYMVQNNPSYQASVRGASVRTYKAETGGNGENLKGTLLSAGSFSIRVSGDEYFNIFPCWDWSKIPGVTSLNQVPSYIKEWGEPGKTVFVGGVSDGKMGAFAMDYAEYGVRARKGYFFFKDEIICLGAGIEGNDPNVETITSINQCLCRGDVVQDTGSVYHDHIAYYSLDSSRMIVEADIRQGSWRDINLTQSKDYIRQKIFSLYIDHGKDTKDGKYSYMIVPGLTQDEFRSHLINHIEVLRNDSFMQAVVNTKTHELQVVFYEAGGFDYRDLKLYVNSPCAVLIPDYKLLNDFYISDPSQKRDQMLLSLNKKEYKIRLPKGSLSGSSISVHI